VEEKEIYGGGIEKDCLGGTRKRLYFSVKWTGEFSTKGGHNWERDLNLKFRNLQ